LVYRSGFSAHLFSSGAGVWKTFGKNTSEFFASAGRCRVACGISMVATLSRVIHPTGDQFRPHSGRGGQLAVVAFTLTGVATVFFYARLWRRSGY